jgi:hypothetical protein
MSGKRIHKRRDIVQISFPNNRRSTRFPRRKVVTKRVWKEEESSAYFGVPASAIFTPFDIPNPTDNAPSFSHTIHYSDVGGYAPAPILGFRAFATTSREVYGGLSPTSNDTDGDGLYDGQNVSYTYTLDHKNHVGEDWNGNGIYDPGQEPNPLSPDTDGDSANDGQELFGYDLVWMQTRSDGSVAQNDAKGTKSNPLDATNAWRDLDDDGISDYNETHYADAYTNVVSWANAKSLETGGEFNATEYLTNQFNPFVAENIPPMITYVNIDTWDDWGWSWGLPVVEASWSKIDVWAMDVADFTIIMGVKDRNSYLAFSGLGGGIERYFTATIGIDYWADSLAEYYVNVTVTDKVGNVAYFEKEVAGFFGGIMNFLEDVWNGIAGAFEAAWEAVKSAVNWIVDWIKGIIQAFFNNVLQPIINGIRNLGNEILTTLQTAINGGFTAEQAAGVILGIILGSTIFIAIMAIVGSLSVVNTATNIVTGGSAALLSQFSGFVVALIIGYFIAETAAKMADLDISNIIPANVDNAISTTFKLSSFFMAFGMLMATKTRVLKSAQNVAPVGLGVAILGLIVFTAKTLIVTGKNRIDYGNALIFDAISIALLSYTVLKLKNFPWVARWYKVLDIAQDAMGLISLGATVTATVGDVSGYITAGG